MKDKKVAILTGFNPFKYKGGAEKYTLQLKKVLEKNNIKVEIMFPSTFKSPKDLYIFCNKIKSYIENDFDLLIYNSPYGLFSNIFKISKIAIIHGSFRMMALNTKNFIKTYDFLRWFHMDGMIEFTNIQNADLVIAVSKYTKNNIKTLYPQISNKRIEIIKNSIDTDFFKPIQDKILLRKKYKIPENVIVGLFVGRTDSTKGYDIFKEVYRQTRKNIYWIQALSSGGINQYEPLYIPTYKEVEPEVMVELYNISDFVYLPTRYEGFGFAFLESLACKTPALTSNVGIATEFKGIWKDFKLDIHLSREQIIKSSLLLLELLIKYRNLRLHLGDLGHKIVKNKFNMNKWEEKIIKIVLSQTSSSAKV